MNNKKDQLWKVVEKFVKDQQISCPECVCQSDKVIENAYEFIGECCDIVGYYKCEE